MKRKTEDEYEIQGYYPPNGWECVTTETTLRGAIDQLKTYRENEPGTLFRKIHKRVPIES
jgi:hypothetical protein